MTKHNVASKQELVAMIADVAEITKAEAGRQLDNVLAGMEAILAGGEGFKITGFAQFLVVDTDERNGVNPQTGEHVVHPATTTIKVKVSPTLKALVKDED